MLFTLTGMAEQKISANLMSLGALDFGIIDGASGYSSRKLYPSASREAQKLKGGLLSRSERFKEVFLAAKQARPLIFGQLIILVVYLPIFTLTG